MKKKKQQKNEERQKKAEVLLTSLNEIEPTLLEETEQMMKRLEQNTVVPKRKVKKRQRHSLSFVFATCILLLLPLSLPFLLKTTTLFSFESESIRDTNQSTDTRKIESSTKSDTDSQKNTTEEKQLAKEETVTFVFHSSSYREATTTEEKQLGFSKNVTYDDCSEQIGVIAQEESLSDTILGDFVSELQQEGFTLYTTKLYPNDTSILIVKSKNSYSLFLEEDK